MRVHLEYIGRGAKWSIVVIQLACLFNSYLVTGGDDSVSDIDTSESRSPYVYLAQREYQVNPSSGQYEEVAHFPEKNVTVSPPGTLRKYTEKLKEKQRSTRREYEEEEGEEDEGEQNGENSERSGNVENAYNYADEEAVEASERSDAKPASIQDILHQRQGQYVIATTTPGYTGSSGVAAQAESPSYDNIQFQSPLISYEVPSNYFPSENYDWPSTYTSAQYGPPQGPAALVTPFISGVGQLTSSVKHIKTQIGEQKAKAAFQVAEVVKGTGHAVNNAILNKGHVASQVIGQTIQTAGEALKSKGWTAQKIIANKGHLATSAIQSVGNVGSSLLRSKGELIGSVLKTGAAIGTTALGTASNALAGGTYLIKAKGDAASNLIAKGGRLASGVIGTKGRIISSVINAKGQFVAQIVEAKGRAAATLLESSGQKLTQLANAIKSATSQKNPGWGWGSAPSESYSAPQNDGGGNDLTPPPEKPAAQLHQEQDPVISNHQHAHQYQQSYNQDYADTYYDPRDTYQHKRQSNDEYDDDNRKRRNSVREHRRSRVAQRQNEEEEDDDHEVFQNEYTSYYLPYHYSPSSYSKYAQDHEYSRGS